MKPAPPVTSVRMTPILLETTAFASPYRAWDMRARGGTQPPSSINRSPNIA